MGSHTFTWPHQASEVYVTGTFDNWQKTVKLEKHANDFHKTVDLPAEKILYKFVVDGNWTTDHTAAQEQDDQGIYNNVLTADQLKSAPSSHSFLSSAAPTATTAAMAGQVPLERNDREVHHEAPGAFPITPANELQQFSVNPIPATSSAPVPGGEGASNPIKLAAGEAVPESSTYTPNKVDTFASSGTSAEKSGSALDAAHGTEGTLVTHPAEEAERAFGVAPLPATSGIGNPIHLAPGEPVPHPSTFTSNTVHSTIGDMSSSGAPQLPPISPTTEREANGANMFDLPALGSGPGPMIPESSLPMGLGAGAAAIGAGALGGAAISSAAPQSTSAQLAGQVPIRERGVPEVVTESEKAAHQSPEAAAYTEPVEQKSAVEEELLAKVPEARGVDAVGHGNAMGVPPAVTESQNRADVDPEAAASSTAVNDKSAMEDELKAKVPEEPATSSSGVFGSSERGITGAIAGGAVAAGGAIAAAAYAAKDKAQPTIDQYTGNNTATTTTTTKSVDDSFDTVPAAVTESQHAAHAAPEASAEPEVVHEKADMEQELKAKVSEAPATSESGLLGKSEGGLTGKATAGIAAGTAAAGAAVAGGIYAARDKTAEATGVDKNTILPPSVASTLDSLNTSKGTTAPTSATSTNGLNSSVPEEVIDSQKAAHVSPEASANPEAVAEKSLMEKELLKEVKPHNETGEPAPTAVASALSATGPEPTTTGTSLSPPGEPTMGAPPFGLNAGANSQAQSLATKTGALANSEQVKTDNTNYDTAVVGNTPNPPAAGLTESANAKHASAKEIAERALGGTVLAGGAAAGAGYAASSSKTAPTSTTPAATTTAATTSTSASAPLAKENAPISASSATVPPPISKDTPAPVKTEMQKEKSPFDAKKTDNLDAPAKDDSRDVSPMSKGPRAARDDATAPASGTIASSTPEGAVTTPQSTPTREKSKRTSIFRGTPDSHKTSGTTPDSPAGSNAEGKPKKKGFLAKLKEKLKA